MKSTKNKLMFGCFYSKNQTGSDKRQTTASEGYRRYEISE